MAVASAITAHVNSCSLQVTARCAASVFVYSFSVNKNSFSRLQSQSVLDSLPAYISAHPHSKLAIHSNTRSATLQGTFWTKLYLPTSLPRYLLLLPSNVGGHGPACNVG